MKVRAVEIQLDNGEQVMELCEQLERQCIQTVELIRRPGFVVRVAPHFGDTLDPELCELFFA